MFSHLSECHAGLFICHHDLLVLLLSPRASCSGRLRVAETFAGAWLCVGSNFYRNTSQAAIDTCNLPPRCLLSHQLAMRLRAVQSCRDEVYQSWTDRHLVSTRYSSLVEIRPDMYAASIYCSRGHPCRCNDHLDGRHRVYAVGQSPAEGRQEWTPSSVQDERGEGQWMGSAAGKGF